MTRTLAALLLCLTGCATAPAVDPCLTHAKLAQDVAESRQLGIEGGAILHHYQMQMAEWEAQDRAVALRVIRIASDGRQSPGEARHAVYLKCKAGEFAPKKP